MNLKELYKQLQEVTKCSYTEWSEQSITLDVKEYRFCWIKGKGLSVVTKKDTRLRVELTDVDVNISEYNNSHQIYIKLIHNVEIGEIYFYEEKQ